MSPLTFNRRFTAYRRVSTATSSGGINPINVVELRSFPGNIQSSNPPRGAMEFGAVQVQCSHHIYTECDVSDLKKEDWVKDLDSGKEFTVTFVDNAAGMDRLWRIDAWIKT